MEELNGGQALLKELIKGLIVTNDWYQVKKRIGDKLFDYTKPGSKTGEADIDSLPRPLRYQVMLDVVGPEIREIWGPEAEEAYKPELLREPYIPIKKAQELRALVSQTMTAIVSKLLADASPRNAVISSAKQRYMVASKVRARTVLEHRRGGGAGAGVEAGAGVSAVVKGSSSSSGGGGGGGKDTEAAALLREHVGSALMAMIRDEDLLVRLFASPLTPQSAYNAHKTDDGFSKESYMFGGGGAQRSAEDDSTRAVRAIEERYNPQVLDALCARLRGSLLSESLRVELWAFKYLRRTSVEAPHPAGASVVHELARRTANKGYDVSSARGFDRSDMGSMITSAVEAGIAASLPISMAQAIAAAAASAAESGLGNRPSSREYSSRPALSRAGSSSSSSGSSGQYSYGETGAEGGWGGGGGGGGNSQQPSPFATLTSRARLLVHAAYLLDGDFSSRVVHIAILLMRVFPKEPPTGEVILRIFQRITLECLPSEQLHHEYSLATVAHEAWALLLKRDPELTYFLQNYRMKAEIKTSDAAAVSSGTGSGDNDADRADRERGLSKAPIHSSLGSAGVGVGVGVGDAGMEAPRSLVLLRGWLEDCFQGWVGEHTSLYLWDQLTLFGACPANFREMLPTLCCVLLRAMRTKLLALPAGQDLLAAMRTFGRSLRTRSVVEAVRCEPSFAKYAPARQYMPDKSDVDRLAAEAEAAFQSFVSQNQSQNAPNPNPIPIPIPGQQRPQSQANSQSRKGPREDAQKAKPLPDSVPDPTSTATNATTDTSAAAALVLVRSGSAVSALGMESASQTPSGSVAALPGVTRSPLLDGSGAMDKESETGAGGARGLPLDIDLGGLATKALSREGSAGNMLGGGRGGGGGGSGLRNIAGSFTALPSA